MVGVDPETASEITAQNGRYGPYLKKGTDSRSLETEEQLFDITLDEALAIYAQPKQRGRAAAAAAAQGARRRPGLRQAGRGQGRPLRPVRHRRRDNATLRKDDAVEAITLERAAELLAERRAKGPAKKAARRAPRRRRPRRPAKKTTQEDREEDGKKAAAKKA